MDPLFRERYVDHVLGCLKRIRPGARRVRQRGPRCLSLTVYRYTVKNVRLSADTLWRVLHILTELFLSWLQFVQCLCILFLFYLTVLIACMICFYYNVCNCHAFIKGNLLTYLRRRHVCPSSRNGPRGRFINRLCNQSTVIGDVRLYVNLRFSSPEVDFIADRQRARQRNSPLSRPQPTAKRIAAR